MPHDIDDDQKEPPGAIAAACVLREGACVDSVFASEYSLTDVNNKSDVNYTLVTKHSNFTSTESSYISNPGGVTYHCK